MFLNQALVSPLFIGTVLNLEKNSRAVKIKLVQRVLEVFTKTENELCLLEGRRI